MWITTTNTTELAEKCGCNSASQRGIRITRSTHLKPGGVLHVATHAPSVSDVGRPRAGSGPKRREDSDVSTSTVASRTTSLIKRLRPLDIHCSCAARSLNRFKRGDIPIN